MPVRSIIRERYKVMKRCLHEVQSYRDAGTRYRVIQRFQRGIESQRNAYTRYSQRDANTRYRVIEIPAWGIVIEMPT